MSYNPFEMDLYDSRQKLLNDKHRPKYHFLPPEGSWNDINGAFFHKGRYHLGYLRKIRNSDGADGGTEFFSSWGHISSRDLLHWVHHPTSISDGPAEGYKRGYIGSGCALLDKRGVPTFFAIVRGKGMFAFQSDDDMEHWRPMTKEPVVKVDDPRFPLAWTAVFMDSECWLEGGVYYALLGQRSLVPGYEGDSTSLFSSKDLVNWKYEHPFYKSDRRWTDEIEDCACPNFFPFGDKYMLVMHTHLPYTKCQYYIGEYRDHVFYPEKNGQLSYPASLMGGPRLLLDGSGRRLFWGWIRDPRPASKYGWNSIMSLPWHFTPSAGGGLAINPVEELKGLRYAGERFPDIELKNEERKLNISSECMELKLRIRPGNAPRFGVKLFCSADGEEETAVTYDRNEKRFTVDFSRSSKDKSIRYAAYAHESWFPWAAGKLRAPADCYVDVQEIPWDLEGKELVELDIYADKSVIEIFVNGEICIVQRVYPQDSDGGAALFAQGGNAFFGGIEKWEMEAVNPW